MILQEHVPALLKYHNLNQSVGTHVTEAQMADSARLKKHIVKMVENIAAELVIYTRNGK